MAFPDLARKVDPNSPTGFADLWLEGSGVPDNGINTFLVPWVDPEPTGSGIDPDFVDPDWMIITVQPSGPGITGFSFVSLSADKRFMTTSWVADGVTAATVIIQLLWSGSR